MSKFPTWSLLTPLLRTRWGASVESCEAGLWAPHLAFAGTGRGGTTFFSNGICLEQSGCCLSFCLLVGCWFWLYLWHEALPHMETLGPQALRNDLRFMLFLLIMLDSEVLTGGLLCS